MRWCDARQLGQEYLDRDLRGVCAICGEAHLVRLCWRCRAVFCSGCRTRVFARGLAAVKSLLGRGNHGKVLVEGG